MWDYLRRHWIVSGTGEAWQSLSLSAKVNIALAVVATLTIIGVVLVVGSRQDYITLYADINPDELSQIQEVLQNENISYRMSEDYTAIQVPPAKAGQARVALRANDLPTQYGLGDGWELMDQSNIWASEDQREQMRQRAIQGELQRMLTQLDFVKSASVFIFHAPQALLDRHQKPSEATVVLDVTRPLTRQEIDVVVETVAPFGGANLTTDTITVSTTKGEMLHAPKKDEVTRVASNKVEVIQQIERDREQRIREAFAEIGKKAIVRVSAQVDFSKVHSRAEEVGDGAELSTLESTSELSTEESLPEGAPGIFANQPEGTPGPTRTETVETTEQNVTNAEPSRTFTERTTDPGEIMGYRVSAWIDGSYEPVLDGEGNPTGEQQYVALTEQEIDEYKQLIANAVGADDTIISVEDVFVKSENFQQARTEGLLGMTPAQLQAQQRTVQYWQLATLAGKILLVLALIFFVRYMFLKMIAPPEPEPEPEEEPAPEGPTQIEIRKQKVAEEVEQLAQQQPDAVAALLRAWMSESED